MTELPSWDTLANWAAQGQQAVERAAAELDPGQVAGPSRLPGWSRGHVLSHLARNADALVNLLTWARTGIEAVPADVAWTLAADVAAWMSSRTEVTAELRATGQPGTIRLGPGGEAQAVVEGSPQRIAGWLTGRVQDQAGLTVAGDLENLPRWL